MSRETKVGLVVIASFLGLVAGVFIVKYSNFGNAPATGGNDTNAAASAESMQSPAIPAAPMPKKDETASLSPAPSIHLTPPPIKDSEDPKNLVRVKTSSDSIPLTPPGDIKPTRFESAAPIGLPDTPPPTEKKNDAPVVSLPMPDDKKNEPPPLIELPGSEPKKDEKPANKEPKKDETAPTITIPGSEPKKDAPAPTLSTPGSEPKTTDSAPTISLPEPKKPDPPGLIDLPAEPKKNDAAPTITLPGAEKPMPKPSTPGLSLPGDPSPSGSKEAKPKDAVVVPLPDPKNDAPKTIDLPGNDKKPVDPSLDVPPALKPPEAPKLSTPDPWKTAEPGKPADPPKINVPEAVKPLDPAADKSLPTKSSDPPAVRLQLPMNGVPDFPDPPAHTAPQEEPRVDSYEEEWYSCQAGETLERISQRFFNTDKYAQALRLHNLDRDGRDLWRQERPALQAGDIVKVPPARILERNHPSVIPGAKLPAGTRPISTSSVPTTNRGFGELTSVRSANTDEPPTYQLPRDGMTFRDVARETLGSSDKWMQVFRLNRGYNPELPLPRGAMLRLPSDARVP